MPCRSDWMRIRSHTLILILITTFSRLFAACSVAPARPCTEGGEPAADHKIVGTRQCVQKKNASGKYVNDGPYKQWYANGQLALEGDYKLGRKHGKWTEWDDKGHKVTEKLYENGVVVREQKPAYESD